MKYIASCSFGKDSLASIITRVEHNEPVDEAVYCRIMFDAETSAEYPEHEEWIHGHAIPLLKSRYGIKTTIVQGRETYVDCFYRKYESGKKTGKIWAFPFLNGPWCNSQLKVRPMNAWGKSIGEYVQIVGIAFDEPKRSERDTVKGKILPLVEHLEEFDERFWHEDAQMTLWNYNETPSVCTCDTPCGRYAKQSDIECGELGVEHGNQQ
jgi:hypothetical protein